MDFLAYAEGAARLLNTPLSDRASLIAYLDTPAYRVWQQDRVTDQDVTTLTRFQKKLRPSFECSVADDPAQVIATLNSLLRQHPITPFISDHNPDRLHLHVATRSASVADLVISEALLGLATVVCDLGPDRLGACRASPCVNVFVDTSPNHSRRYCSDRCSSRANVAAFRARKRAAAS